MIDEKDETTEETPATEESSGETRVKNTRVSEPQSNGGGRPSEPTEE